METFIYGKDHLTASKALKISRNQLSASIDNETSEKIRKSEAIVKKIAAGEQVIYGINSGFGPLCTTKISAEKTRLLQQNILKSHSVGVGSPVPKEIVKLMLILKAHALSKGFSGISENTVRRIIWHIENDILPLVPSQGSVGASGDLAPLAHLFLPLIGEGEVWYQGGYIRSTSMLKKEGLKPLDLGPKEGLALINGTQFMAAYAVIILEKLHTCLSQADIIASLMLEALLGSVQPFMPQLHELRAHPGIQHVAARINGLLAGSEIVRSHKNCERVQDPYSIRCIPQVHGTSRQCWLHLKEVLEIELNAVTDNPLIISSGLALSGGNFHGQPLALPLDYISLAASELGSISDRRIYLALDGNVTGLPKLLMENIGLNSGFMILQYTTAALVSENKSQCYPASADSIPTSLGQEDHVSMGSISARKALLVIQNLQKILAIELICACQGLDFRRPLRSTDYLEKVHSMVRESIPHLNRDRVMQKEINMAMELVSSSSLLQWNKAWESDHFQKYELY